MYTIYLSGEESLEVALRHFESHAMTNHLSRELQERVSQVAQKLDKAGRSVLASKSTMSAQQVVDLDGTRVKLVANYGVKPRRSFWAMLKGIFGLR